MRLTAYLDSWDIQQRLVRKSRGWRRAFDWWRRDRTLAWEARRRRVDTLSEQALTERIQVTKIKLLVKELDQDTLAAVKAIVKEQSWDELMREAVGIARERLTGEYADREEALRAKLARQRAQIEADAEARLDEQTEKARELLREEMARDIADLKNRVRTARGQRDQAESALLHVLSQLLSERPRFLHDSGVQTLDLGLINGVLARRAFRIQAIALHSSERQVQVTLDPHQAPVNRARFALVPLAAGATDQDETDAEVTADASNGL